MSLFQVFQEKSVQIQSTQKVYPAFTKVRTIAEILQELDGEATLILHRVPFEVADWIRSSPVPCTLYTTAPSTLEEWDAVKSICETCPVYIVPAIGMNYIHCSDTLFIIPERFSNSSVANVVMITSMTKKEIDTQIAIDIGKIAAQFGVEPTSACDSNNVPTTAAENPKVFTFSRDDELQLMREEITKRMSESYCIVKTEMPNISIDRKTVSLTEFYKKNGIARGRLRGTWEIFDPYVLPKIMDNGIAQRALDRVNKQYTVSVENAYKLVHKEELMKYQHSIKQIESDYRSYLRGHKVSYVGAERIKVPFSPGAAIDASIFELTRYLKSIETPSAVRYSVEAFTKDAKRKIFDSIANAESRTVITAFAEEQLNDPRYVSKLWKAICDNSNFFDGRLIMLIQRYYDLFSEQQEI